MVPMDPKRLDTKRKKKEKRKKKKSGKFWVYTCEWKPHMINKLRN